VTPLKTDLLREIRNSLNKSWNLFFSTITGLFVVIGFLGALAVYIVAAVLIISLIKKFKKSGPKT